MARCWSIEGLELWVRHGLDGLLFVGEGLLVVLKGCIGYKGIERRTTSAIRVAREKRYCCGELAHEVKGVLLACWCLREGPAMVTLSCYGRQCKACKAIMLGALGLHVREPMVLAIRPSKATIKNNVGALARKVYMRGYWPNEIITRGS
ncbi:unnamed protein product [Dovyalis caffra]|uniref:Uncharacterized protein n=1 Tax=Dovyalis caffra TaxID=77055 RepID=A0AAV1SQ00_9ROSI|nr:unnamed protein product [Dovyalis caffra]